MKKLFVLFAAVTLFVGVQACKQKAEEATEEVTAAADATTEEVTAATDAGVDSITADAGVVVDAAKDAAAGDNIATESSFKTKSNLAIAIFK